MCGTYEICGICFLIEELFQVCGSGSKSEEQVFLLLRMAAVMRFRGQPQTMGGRDSLFCLWTNVTIGDSTKRKRKQETFDFSLGIQESKRSKEKSNNTDCVYFRTKYRLFDYMKLLFRVSERIFTPTNEKSNTTLFLRIRVPFQSVRSTKICTACKITRTTVTTMQNMKTAQHSEWKFTSSK